MRAARTAAALVAALAAADEQMRAQLRANVARGAAANGTECHARLLTYQQWPPRRPTKFGSRRRRAQASRLASRFGPSDTPDAFC